MSNVKGIIVEQVVTSLADILTRAPPLGVRQVGSSVNHSQTRKNI